MLETVSIPFFQNGFKPGLKPFQRRSESSDSRRNGSLKVILIQYGLPQNVVEGTLSWIRNTVTPL